MTNIQLNHRSGTEIVVRDLEAALRKRGHEVCVYTESLGIISDEIAERGGLAVTSLEDVPFVPDVIHGHHSAQATAAAIRFPGTPVVFVCHSRHAWFDMVIGVPAVQRCVAVDLNCRDRLLAEGIAESDIELITNAVDLERFALGVKPASALIRAAIFGNSARPGGFADVVAAACLRAGVELDVFGRGVGTTIHQPETVLAEYDLVFAKARCAIEAMALGCAVIAVDAAGYGGLVTAHDVDRLLDWNVGDRCLQRPHDVATIVSDIARIDWSDVATVAARVRERCDLSRAAEAYERIYGAMLAPGKAVTPARWQDAHTSVVEFATALESRARIDDGVWSMPPIPPSVGEGLHVVVHESPHNVRQQELFVVDVEIDNRSRERLASCGATPVRFSYHWLDRRTYQVAVFDGERTELSEPVPGGRRHRQLVNVSAPPQAGEYWLRITMVQEAVAWFTNFPQPVFADVAVEVGPARSGWFLGEIGALTGVVVERDALIANLGFLSSPLPAMLTFATTMGFLTAALDAGCVAVVVPSALAPAVPHEIGIVATDAPAATFWRFHQRLIEMTDFYGRAVPSQIDPTASIHPDATVARWNVRIGADSTIEAGAVITGRVDIGDRVVVRAGAVVGADGFQTIGVDGGISDFTHAGSVVIGDDARVMSNATIARGLFRQSTRLGEWSRVGNNAFVSHNCIIGPRTTVGHGAVVNGSVVAGHDVWIGPRAVLTDSIHIGDGARIDLGSTVIGSVRDGEHVGGAPAIDHRVMLREVASWRSRGRRR